jgi:serpin B
MHDAFTRFVADFSGIDEKRERDGLYIDNALHQANIDVTESGTVAAAATGLIGAVATSIEFPPPPRAEITFNRPFLFAIVDEPTGAIVFLGRATDPSAF